jgi:hypothetical protein
MLEGNQPAIHPVVLGSATIISFWRECNYLHDIIALSINYESRSERRQARI